MIRSPLIYVYAVGACLFALAWQLAEDTWRDVVLARRLAKEARRWWQ